MSTFIFKARAKLKSTMKKMKEKKDIEVIYLRFSSSLAHNNPEFDQALLHSIGRLGSSFSTIVGNGKTFNRLCFMGTTTILDLFRFVVVFCFGNSLFVYWGKSETDHFFEKKLKFCFMHSFFEKIFKKSVNFFFKCVYSFFLRDHFNMSA
jgi:hypothetical protein